jgi:hypothetical protein
MPETPKQRENLAFNLICNIAIPTVILMKFSSDKWLGPLYGLLLALAFPLGYGLWDFYQRRKTNLFSIIGFISVLLSGGLGLAKVEGIWFAVKDAAIPIVLGLAVLVSLRTKKPLVRTVLLNDQIIDVQRVETALEERGTRNEFEGVLKMASYGLAASFFLVAVLHFFLVRHILQSPPGTEAFNNELGRVHVLNIPIVVVPSMITLMLVLWQTIKAIERLTGLNSEQIFHSEPEKKK